MHYFYDRQFERYLLQFMRIFTEIKVSSTLENGSLELKRIPIVNGAMSRQVASILKGNSENTMISTPMFSAYIKEVELDPKRRAAPGYVNPIARTERAYNNITSSYQSDSGNKVTVERLMPVPYKVTFVLDILTSNMHSKMEILEQILSIFNPMLQLQSNSNVVDWSRLFEVELTRVNWSGTSLPVGTDDQKEIATLTFDAPIFINPPAKVKVSKLIQQIVTNVHLASTEGIDNSGAVYDPFSFLQVPQTQVITTPKNYKVSIGIDGFPSNKLVLRKEFGTVETEGNWKDLLEQYGGVTDTTKIALRLSSNIEDDSDDIVGTISYDNTNGSLLNFVIDIDTLPTTNNNVLGIINPKIVLPGSGAVATIGAKYIIDAEGYHIDEPVILPNQGWGNLIAYNNDIVEFNGSEWNVVFNSAEAANNTHVLNIQTNEFYTYFIQSKEWSYSFLGEYSPGYWRIIQ